MTFYCLVPKWNNLLFCVLYLCWVRILYFEVHLVVVLKWKMTERRQSLQRFFLSVRYYIWKNLTSAVVLVKLPSIFRTQMKWCNKSKNDHVTIFIEIILWRICLERIQVKCFYPPEILTHTTFSLSVSISWVIFHLYTYLQYPIFCNVFMWHFYSGK